MLRTAPDCEGFRLLGPWRGPSGPISALSWVLRGTSRATPQVPGRTETNPAANAVQSLVVATEAGQRRIALFQNTPAAFHGRPQLVEESTDELTEVARQGELVA